MRTSSRLIQEYYHVKVGHKFAGIISQVDTVSLLAAGLLRADFTAVFYRAADNDALIPLSYQYGEHLTIRHFELLEATWGRADIVNLHYERVLTDLAAGHEDPVVCEFGAQNGFVARYLFPIYEDNRLAAVFLAYWYEPPPPVPHDTEVMLDLVSGVLTAALSIANQLLLVENYSSRLSDVLSVLEMPLGELSFGKLLGKTTERAAHLVADARSILLSRDTDSGKLQLSEWFGGEKPSDDFVTLLIEQVDPIRGPGSDDTDTGRHRSCNLMGGATDEIGDMVALPINPDEEVQLVLVVVVGPDCSFTHNDRELLAVFGAFAQTVLRNALLIRRLRKANLLLERSSARLANAETMAALTDMTSGVAHDFNNIFGGIIGRVQLLKLRQTDPKTIEGLDKIEQLVSDGAETVRRIQEFSTGGGPAGLRPVDLARIFSTAVNDQASDWRKMAIDKQVTVEPDCLVSDASIDGSETDLMTVFRKLLENAIEHSPADSRVTARLEADDRHYIISVIDHGEGISDENREKVFYPFFTTKTEHGAGLGLAIVHGIVARQGGDIKVAVTEGGGATFTVRLKCSELPPDARDASSRIRIAANLKVLVVDDDEQIRDVLSDMLNINGHKAVACCDGYTALEAVEKERFDILITDLGMPGMSGLDLADAVHQKHPDMPIAMITGWGMQLNKEEVALKGIQAILAKPFHLKEIRQLVDDLAGA